MATVVGGVQDAGGLQNSTETEELARFAVEEHNKKANALLEFVRVVNVKEQVVAGTIYTLTLEALDGGEKKLYEAKVWVKPWMHFKELQEFNQLTESPSAAGGTLGSVQDADGSQNSIAVDELGLFAVEEHNKKANALLEFVQVVKVKEQVVSGTLYYLTVEAIDGGEKKLYEAKVWVKPWMNFKELQEFNELGQQDD